MRIYWYWPNPHRTANPTALAMLRPEDSLTVQALPSLRGETFGPIDEYEVIRDLPDPTSANRSGWRRWTYRTSIAVARARARRSLLRERTFDIAHLNALDHQYNWIDLPAVARRVPLLSHVHDVRPHAPLLPRSIETRLLRATYARAGDLLVYDDVLRHELVADFGVEPERVHTIPHPLKLVDETDPAVVRPDRPLVLFFGTLRTNKGVDVLLDALDLLGPDRAFDVLIAGAGTPEVCREIARRSSTLGIRFEPGYVSPGRKRELYTAASCVVLPYRQFHSQSGVLLDAYTFRVPVVVSDVGALGPTVRRDGTGMVVPPGDPAALAGALERAPLRSCPELAAALEATARRHDPSVVGPQLRAVYDLVVSRSSSGR